MQVQCLQPFPWEMIYQQPKAKTKPATCLMPLQLSVMLLCEGYHVCREAVVSFCPDLERAVLKAESLFHVT